MNTASLFTAKKVIFSLEVFPPKKESIPYRYKLFLEMYGEDTAEVWKKAYSKTWKRAKALRGK